MSEFTAEDVEVVRPIASCDQYSVFEAVSRADSKPVRLTVFSAEVSQCSDFRRALKSNRAMLMMLQHQSVLRFLGSGESSGQLYYWTAPTESRSLAERLQSGRRFSSEDIIEIGWQVCSALQQAHNLGLAHGGLSMETVLISSNLQVTLSQFGVARWLKAARESTEGSSSNSAIITVSTLASREEVEKDLSDLASVLHALTKVETSSDSAESSTGNDAARSPSPIAASSPGTTDTLLERLLARLTSSGNPSQLTSAREFQGRLGEILIGPGDDTMPLVDRRESTGTSKRSIIVELFEPPESLDQIPSGSRSSAGTARRRQILPLMIVAVIIVLATLIAGLFR